jgi:hypothetical protein
VIGFVLAVMLALVLLILLSALIAGWGAPSVPSPAKMSSSGAITVGKNPR